ncbi:MAG TPA: hypothetical protein VF158_08170 [Longimicrobiales bacterium]
MADLLAAIPWPVWALAPAMVVVGWLWAAVHTAPMDTDLWDGGEHGTHDDTGEDDGSADEAEPPLTPGWGKEGW